MTTREVPSSSKARCETRSQKTKPFTMSKIKQVLSVRKPHGHDKLQLACDPFFVLYDARSGSTFLADLLMRTGSVCIPPESNIVTQLLSQWRGRPIENLSELKHISSVAFEDPKLADWGLSEGQVEKALKRKLPLCLSDFLMEVFALYRVVHGGEGAVFGIKKGSYLEFSSEIDALFPRSKYICLIRDGRAVFCSKRRSVHSAWNRPLETDVGAAARQWVRAVRLIRSLEDKLPARTLVLHYEKLVQNVDTVVADILEFLDVEEGAHTLENGQRYRVSERYGTIHSNVGKPPDHSRISAWRAELTAAEVEEYEAIAGERLIAEGYEIVSRSV